MPKHAYRNMYILTCQSTYIEQNHIKYCQTLVLPRWTNSKGHAFAQSLSHRVWILIPRPKVT